MYSMLKRMRQDYNVFVGTETGILKGVNLDHKAVVTKNFHNIKALERGHEITAMEWGNPEQTEIMMGLRNQTVRVFDVSSKIFISSKELKSGVGPIVSIAKYKESVVTAAKSGHVSVWNNDGHKEFRVVKKGYLCRMKADPLSPNHIATCGKFTNLALWDLEATETPIFEGKNLRPGIDQLPPPLWVSDLVFMSEPNCIATCSRHSNVQLFDPKVQRRPVVKFKYEEEIFSSIADVPKTSQVIVGTSHGKMLHFDLRMPKAERALGALKGFAGGVRSIAVHPDFPVVFSVSIDRFLRVHNLKTHKLMLKEYLKSRLNTILLRKSMQRSDLFPEELETWEAECLEEEETDESDGEDSTTTMKAHPLKKPRMTNPLKKRKNSI